MTGPAEILDFWFAGDMTVYRALWFRRDEAFDTEIRRRFAAPVAAAREGALDGWAATPEGLLALVLLLDQMPRNLFRGDPAAFASDPQARVIARAGVLRDGLDLRLPWIGRSFLYLPLEHSEAMADQDLSVALFEGLRDIPAARTAGSVIDHAWRHHRVIRAFGRFPHRNPVLGRPDSPAEVAFRAVSDEGF
jgi:uncharacterized protein (DUF924 family)